MARNFTQGGSARVSLEVSFGSPSGIGSARSAGRGGADEKKGWIAEPRSGPSGRTEGWAGCEGRGAADSGGDTSLPTRGLSPEMALGTEKAFGVSMDTLLRMQAPYDSHSMGQLEGEINVNRYEPP